MVFQAHDRELDELVALKVLKSDMLTMDSTMLERFKQEIRVARRVTHRNVVRTYDIGDMDGVKFISMEYVQGMTLKQLIRKRGCVADGGGCSNCQTNLIRTRAAHQQGVVHRDVKPQNIIITPASEVKIMDFGIARPMNKSGMTATGSDCRNSRLHVSRTGPGQERPRSSK